jgi:hypothetical protein
VSFSAGQKCRATGFVILERPTVGKLTERLAELPRHGSSAIRWMLTPRSGSATLECQVPFAGHEGHLEWIARAAQVASDFSTD